MLWARVTFVTSQEGLWEGPQCLPALGAASPHPETHRSGLQDETVCLAAPTAVPGVLKGKADFRHQEPPVGTFAQPCRQACREQVPAAATDPEHPTYGTACTRIWTCGGVGW